MGGRDYVALLRDTLGGGAMIIVVSTSRSQDAPDFGDILADILTLETKLVAVVKT